MTRQIAAYLITLAVGYWVLTLAGKEKGTNQKIGKVIGWIIIVVSLFGPLCLAACHMKCGSDPVECSYMSHCPMEKGGMPGDMQGMMGDKDKK